MCDACKLSLVDSLSTECGDSPEIRLAELARFTNVSAAEMVREILETNEIQTIQRGEVDPIGITSGAEPITLWVEERDLPHARELFEAYYAGSNITPPQPDEE